MSTKITELTDNDILLRNGQLFVALRQKKSIEGKLEIIQKRLNQGANVNASDGNNKNNTPLHIAVQNAELEVVKLLLDSGASFHKTNDDNKTAIDFASQLDTPNSLTIVKLLEDKISLVLDSKIDDLKNKNQEVSKTEDNSFNIERITKPQTINKKAMPGARGVVYQLKFLMLFLIRGHHTYPSFHLGTEIEEAKKFDDLVFITTENGKNEFQLLQIKHKEDKLKKIKFDDLVTEADSNYNLVKYFFSFQDSKKEDLFKRGAIKNVTICTNIGLDLDDTFIWRNETKTIRTVVDEIKVKNKILNFNTENRNTETKKPKHYHFNKNIIPSLKEKIESYHLVRIARKLVECILKNGDIRHHQGDFKTYHIILAKEVIDVKNKKLQDNFVSGENLTDYTKTFRKAFVNKLKKQSNDNLNLENLNEAMCDKNNKEIGLKFSNAFGKEKKKVGVTTEKDEESTDWPKDAIAEKDIEDFLECFVLAVDQPNEEELDKIIQKDIRSKFNFKNANPIYQDLFQNMMNWLKGQGEPFITGKTAKNLFESAAKKLSELELSAIYLDYETYIKKFDITFDISSKVTTNLISFLNTSSETTQILNIINQQPLLSAISIKQVTKDISQFRDSSLFTWLDSAQRLLPILKQALLCNNINLLVIESEKPEEEEILNPFCKELLSILQSVKNKKIILITHDDHKIPSVSAHFTTEYENIWFNSLAVKSQDYILNNTVVVFQKKEVSLSSLIVKKELRNFINGEILIKLIKKEKLLIGKSISHSNYRKDHFIDRKFTRLEFLSSRLTKMRENFLFIDDDNSVLHELNSHDDKDIIITSDNQDLYKNLSNTHKRRNIHWLKRKDDKLIWKKSNGALSKLREFFDLEKTEYSTQNLNSFPGNIGIIEAEPGMGKSTILTRLAKETKSLDPNSYIIRLNLLEYEKQFREWQSNKIVTDRSEVEKFLCKVCVSARFEENDITQKLSDLFPNILNIDLTENYFKINAKQGAFLLEVAIFNYFYNQREIMLLFDGFDEIVPYYKNEVLTMLKILKELQFKKLWITTRNYNILNELEDELSTFSFQLQPFFQEDQKLFLKKFWGSNLKIEKFDQKRFNVFADNMLHKFSKSINIRKEDFLAVPLHVNMVAKVFQETFRKFYNSANEELFSTYEQEINELLNLANLYKKFIEAKFFKIRFGENNICSRCFSFVGKIIQDIYEVFLKEHQYLALYVLFEGNEQLLDVPISENKEKNVENILKKIMSGEEKTGIIVNVTNGKPLFIHHTFAEYFVAKHFWTLFKSTTFTKFENTFFPNVIIKCLIKKDKIAICKFFILEAQNDIAANNIAFSDNIFKFDFLLKNLILLLKKETSSFKESNKSTKLFWHIIESVFSSEEHKNINFKLISTIKSLKNKTKLSILKIAAEIGNDNIASLLIEQLDKKFVKDYFEKSESWVGTPLWIAASNENLNILNKIFKIVLYDLMTKERNIDLLESIVFKLDFVVLRSCLKLNMLNVNIPIFNNTSALIGIITRKAPLDIVELFTQKADINFVNESICCSNYNNILALMRFGAYNSNEVVIDFITKKGINLSLGINILFKTMTEIGKFNGFEDKFLKKWYYFHEQYQYVEQLLKYGVGYNCMNKDSKITTLKYFETLYCISKFYNKLFTNFQSQQNFKKFNLTDIVSKHIINLFFQINKEITNWEFIINNDEFSVKNENRKLILCEEGVFSLYYVCYKDGKSAIENALTELNSYVNNNSFEIECIESDISRYYGRVDGYKNLIKCLRNYEIFKSLSDSTKILVEQAVFLNNNGDVHSFKETCKYIEKEKLRSIEVFDRLRKVQSLRNCDKNSYTIDEIYFILNLEEIPIDDELQNILIEGFKDENTESFDNIWSNLIDFYKEEMQLQSFEHFSNYYFHSLQLFELLQQLDTSFHNLLDNIKVKNHQEIEIILGDLQREKPNFVKSILNSQDKKYGFLLHYAVYNSDIESVKILLNYEASPNSQLLEYCEYFNCLKSDFEKYYKGCMPLHLAAEIGDKDIIDFLLNKGSEIDCVDWFGRTPLYYAFKNEKLDIVEYLIKEKNAKHNITDLTAVTDLSKRSLDS